MTKAAVAPKDNVSKAISTSTIHKHFQMQINIYTNALTKIPPPSNHLSCISNGQKRILIHALSHFSKQKTSLRNVFIACHTLLDKLFKTIFSLKKKLQRGQGDLVELTSYTEMARLNLF